MCQLIHYFQLFLRVVFGISQGAFDLSVGQIVLGGLQVAREGKYARPGSVTYVMEKFRRLFRLMPLAPGSRQPSGVPSRWRDIYGNSIGDLATEKSRAIRA